MEKQDNAGQKLPKYSENLRNTGQKIQRESPLHKNENI